MSKPKKVGRKPRAGRAANEKITLRATKTELAAWERAAAYKPLGVWLRELANAAAGVAQT